MPELIRGMVMVKKAAAMANSELGKLSARIADVIIKACDEILIKKNIWINSLWIFFRAGQEPL